MEAQNILNIVPVEIFDRIFWLLSDSRPDISACRLTCRVFCELNAKYLITSVVLATNLRALHRLHKVLGHPDFKKHVHRLIVVEDMVDANDREQYDMVLQDADWTKLTEDDKALWRDLSQYSGSAGTGPEMLQWSKVVLDDDSDYCSRDWLDFYDYIYYIRMNLLERALAAFPKLSEVVWIDYISAITESLIESDHVPGSQTLDDYYRSNSKSYAEDFETLVYLIAACRGGQIRSLSVGPFSVGASAVYWRYHRHRAIDEIGAHMSYHLPLGSIDDLSGNWPDDVAKVMHGLQQLHLPLDVGGHDLNDTSLLAFVKIAAPTLVYLSLDVKGLVLPKSGRLTNDINSVQRDTGSFSFDRFFGELFLPCLIEFQLQGWLYDQSEMQFFLLRHRTTIRRLRLVDNQMLGGNITSLDGFVRDKLELLEIDISSCTHHIQ